MMTSRGLSALCLSLTTALVATTVVAQEPAKTAPAAAPAPAAKPPAELEQLKLFLGTWKCTGKHAASPALGPEHPIAGTAQIKLDLDGYWQRFSYEEKKTSERPNGLKMVGVWGYDAAGKRFIRSAASNEGGWDSATSVGWVGEKMIWTGDLSGPQGRMPFRQRFSKKSDREWSYQFEVNPKGTWVLVSEMVCKK